MSAVDEKLVAGAAQGDKESMDRLAAMARPEIKAFLFRTTMNEDIADDLTQETLLQMLSSLSDLKNYQSFWPWVYRIAVNKANQHYRNLKHTEYSISEMEGRLGEQVESYDQVFESSIDRKEVSSRIVKALQNLKQNQRAIISMRCLDDMPYKHIAQALNCSEIYARVTFIRAKRYLKKELARQGVKAVGLVATITLFGRSTVESSAAAQLSVASASMETSLLAQTVAAVTTKKAAAVAAGVILSAAVLSNLPEDSVVLRNGVNSVHYVVQARNEDSHWASLSKGAYEKWCYFPQGVDGPMILRMQRWDPAMRQRLCSWLQDESGNYYYNVGNNTVYVLNERLGGFLEMPTDTVQMASFITEQEPQLKELKDERDSRSGMLLSRIDNRFKDAPDFHSAYEYNHSDPCLFKPFWPEDSNVMDLRTPMHKRGWTYFTVSGNYYGRKITGAGSIPFVLGAAREHPAWIRMNFGGDYEMVDCPAAAWIAGGSKQIIEKFAPGTFLKGLARPWLGYSALDSVRRDAAQSGIGFHTYFNEDMSWAQVALSVPDGSKQIAVVYEIDLLTDIVKSVNINSGSDDDNQNVNMVFTYLEQIDNDSQDFKEPRVPDMSGSDQNGKADHWLAELAVGKMFHFN